MSAEIRGSDSEEQKSTATPPPEPPGPIESPNGESKPAADPEGIVADRETQNRRPWKKWATPEWVTALSTVAMALTSIALIVTAIVSIKVANKQWSIANSQLGAMKETNDRMREANDRTDKSIGIAKDNYEFAKSAAKSSDEATRESLNLTRQSLDATRKSTELTRLMVAAAERAARAAEDGALQARKGLDHSIAISRLDQRAWLGVKGMSITTLEAGKKVSVAVEITNTGKTIARSSKTFSSLKFSLAPIDIPTFAVSGERRLPKPTPAVFFPGVLFAMNSSSDENASEEDVKLIKARTMLIYVFGELEYADVFGQNHRILYCGIYQPSRSSFDSCSNYNEAD